MIHVFIHKQYSYKHLPQHALGEGGGGDDIGPHILSAEHMGDGRRSVWHKTL